MSKVIEVEVKRFKELCNYADKIERIKSELIGIVVEDLTTAEKNILRIIEKNN